MSVSLDEMCAKLGEDAFDRKIVLIVMTNQQRAQFEDELRRRGQLIVDTGVTRNAFMGVPFEVNDNWVGEPGLLTAGDVEKYRGARRRLEIRMDPARRLEL